MEVSVFSRQMGKQVAASAQGYEVLIRVVSEPAAWFDVVHLEICHASAALTPPSVSCNYLSSKCLVLFRIQS
jgi:hypothetical protein